MPQGVFPNGNKGLFKKGVSPWNMGKKGYTTRKKGQTKKEYPQLSNSGVKKGNIPVNKGKGRLVRCKICGKEFQNNRKKYCSIKCKSKDKVWNKGLKGFITNEKNPNWKGGINLENERIRHSLEYEIWRKEIYKKDSWVCRLCGSKKQIIAHHLHSFSDYPELRFSIENGITLCRKCHLKIHKTIKTCK